ncbi:MAG: histidine phosphatase family protein [Gemmatimonadales bacterium]|nr:histidine phosphatase family protein [Gemmatimonadales bacterium]
MLTLLASLFLAAPADTIRPVTVIVVRHAEKAAEPANNPGLSPAGVARAAAIDSAVADAKVTAILVTPYLRNSETAAPVARRFGLTPIVVPISGGAGGVQLHAAAMAAKARELGGTVLVVGHSNTVGAVVEALGGPKVGNLPETEYTLMWTVVVDGGGVRVVRSRVGER